mmetsp:Transcript_56701/g.90158  ORF Transcript_56701/g.90158 Transcript_56701/m.90158 type:complete len:566 (+) Transcript_56701:114-1811(+)|eukprot:CAMPEP_0169096076 /NCGR_PEP_ID=MMETSP1015-20121227/18809_1 /TAXON_ID=342587 /ORGANISM="Karlodinium micrum, Strain CCMP2283" /LENGTH=565 /DNA_ID=CAMNT_0009156823 /DNA_START=107 /DNA_END=1804 /DNA_ORIENTATION=-
MVVYFSELGDMPSELVAKCSLLQKQVARSVSPTSYGRGNGQEDPHPSLLHSPLGLHLFNEKDLAIKRHVYHLVGLVIICGLVGASIIWMSRLAVVQSRFGSVPTRYIRAFKLAFTVGLSSCCMAAIGGSLVPTGTFHMVSAGITVMIVMEMGSIDRLLLKGFNRVLGTLVGAVQSILAIKIVEAGSNAPYVIFIAILLVTVSNATMQALNTKRGYIFLASNVTFVFVFYGYFQEGGEAIYARILSVFAAVIVSLIVDIVWPLIWLGSFWFSIDNVVEGAEKMLKKTFAIVDFTFVHDEILAQDEGDGVLASSLWKNRIFQPETEAFFQMKSEHLTLGELQKRLSHNAHGKRIADEEEIVFLHSLVKNAWEDVEFTYGLLRRRPPHNYYLLFEKLHAVYSQSCALSHMAYSSLSISGRAIWRSSQQHLEKLREALCSLEPLLLALVRTCHGRSQPSEVDKQVGIVTDALEQAVVLCENTFNGVQTSCKQERWRFEAFLMTVELVVAELSTYVRQLLEHFGSHGEVTEPVIIRSFCNEYSSAAERQASSPADSLIARLMYLSKHTDL